MPCNGGFTRVKKEVYIIEKGVPITRRNLKWERYPRCGGQWRRREEWSRRGRKRQEKVPIVRLVRSNLTPCSINYTGRHKLRNAHDLLIFQTPVQKRWTFYFDKSCWIRGCICHESVILSAGEQIALFVAFEPLVSPEPKLYLITQQTGKERTNANRTLILQKIYFTHRRVALPAPLRIPVTDSPLISSPHIARGLFFFFFLRRIIPRVTQITLTVSRGTRTNQNCLTSCVPSLL